MAGAESRTFRFRRRSVPAPPEEPLGAALTGARVPILGRSIRYHRPRGPFCGVGYCTQCLVRVNGVPNIRSCTYQPRDGDVVATENGWPSVETDLLAAIDVAYPRGIDTLHGFRRPAFLRGLYHRTIRSLAGFGRPPTPVRAPERRPAERLETDVLVVGGGPAGRSASARLAAAGRSVTLLDRGPLLSPPPGASSRPRTTVTFLPPPEPGRSLPFLATAADDSGGSLLLRARSVVLATGAYDAGLLAVGMDRPGVLTASGALALSPGGRDPPFRHALLVGSGERAGEMLDRFGTHIAAALSPGSFAPGVASRAAELDVPLLPRSLLLEVLGRRRVRGVRLRPRGGGPEQRLPVDAVLLAHRRLPNAPLFFQSGARMEWRGGVGAYFPELRQGLETTVPGLFGIGEAAGFLPGAPAEASGIAVAEQLLGGPAPGAIPPRTPSEGMPEWAGYYTQLLSARGRSGKWILCACEDVLLSELEEANRAGYRGIEEVKRYTGVGTGLCQGRFCLPEAILLLSALEQRAPAEVGYIRQRPPVVPTALGAWAALPEEAE
jgi:sarcosine oxidase, subunit alpha